jgi:hypothetical protein
VEGNDNKNKFGKDLLFLHDRAKELIEVSKSYFFRLPLDKSPSSLSSNQPQIVQNFYKLFNEF